MHRLRGRVAAIFSIACCAVALLASFAFASDGKTSSQPVSAPLGGINLAGLGGKMNLSTIDSEMAQASRLHAKVVRIEVAWADFEPNAEGQIDSASEAAADRLFEDASKADIKVIAFVDRTPCWASSAPAALLQTCVPGQSIGGAHAWPPHSAASFANFTAWLANRYGDDLVAIEVWNEPDQANQAYLAGPNKPQRYAELLRAAYPAIKRVDPRIQVLAGSLVGANGAFMNALYQAGIKGFYDGVSVHFYTLTLGSLRVFREDQLAHGDTTPLWLDEFGWSSCWPKQKIQQEQGCVTEAAQAQNLADMIRQLAHTKWIAAETSYNLQDSPHENFGVLSVSGKRKPAFYALAEALASPFGPPTPLTLRLRVHHGQVIASGSGPVGDYMKIEVFQHGVLRWKPFFTLNRFDDYSISLPKVLGTRGLTVHVYQYWMGSGHDARRSI